MSNVVYTNLTTDLAQQRADLKWVGPQERHVYAIT
jgi:hypothetical protein